jgi:2-polyprenyl-3-methyl-5-hydroxy-6-metoxy-1,4-benzoquinol methylase
LAGSFRDPAGSLFRLDGRIFRAVNQLGAADMEPFLASGVSQKLLESRRIVSTRRLADAETRDLLAHPEVRWLYNAISGTMILEHEPIEFPSFAYEWPPEMLHAAGALTLDLAQALLGDGLGLKDGTPYNILFRGPEPVFIDVLSFERRDPGDPTWLPYAQFVRTFLLPLLANQHFGIALGQLLTTRRDGLEPEDVYRWAGPFERLRPGFLSLVSIPTWLGGRHSPDDQTIYQKKHLPDPEKAQFILNSVVKGLRRKLDRLEPKAGKSSAWTGYMDSNNNYSGEQFSAKERFVSEALAELRPQRVLDVGCNTGHFSALAANNGASVVALDYDPVVLGQVWRQARSEKLDILPLVVDLTRPTPGMGWRNRECSPFLERARGRFDAVLMLAVIHHMLVTERVPLADILELGAELTKDVLIVEFIAPEDSMFRRLTRGRDQLHRNLTHEFFENVCREHFEIARVQHVESSTRWLYLLRKRD